MPIEALTYRVVAADDHSLIRAGIRSVLDSLHNFTLVAEASSWDEVFHLLQTQPVDILIADLSMPGSWGIETIKQLKEQFPNLKILVLSMHPEYLYAVRCLRAGASGYLNKEEDLDQLQQALQTIASNQPFLTPKVQQLLLNTSQTDEPHHNLSDREFEIFLQLAQGKTTGEIAESTQLSVKTISTYRRRILDKLGLQTNADIIKYARAHRLTAEL